MLECPSFFSSCRNKSALLLEISYIAFYISFRTAREARLQCEAKLVYQDFSYRLDIVRNPFYAVFLSLDAVFGVEFCVGRAVFGRSLVDGRNASAQGLPAAVLEQTRHDENAGEARAVVRTIEVIAHHSVFGGHRRE